MFQIAAVTCARPTTLQRNVGQQQATRIPQIGRGLEAANATLQPIISANTMKIHLGRIYTNTGTTRQADIIKLYGASRRQRIIILGIDHT